MTTLLIVLLVFFTLASAFFSGSETTLFSLPPTKIRSFQISKRAHLQRIADLVNRPRDLLVTILMLNVFVNLFVQNIASNLFEETPSWLLKVGVPFAITLIFGEILPKSIALANNESLAPKVAPTIQFSRKCLSPLRFILTRVTAVVVRIVFFFLKRSPELTDEQLDELLKTSEKYGVLEGDETELIRGCLHLQKATVKELMQPRGDVLFYDMDDPLSKLTYFFSEKGCSRIPVCQGGLENLCGILDARLFFIQREKVDTSHDLFPLLRKPIFVPEMTLAKVLLQEMKEKAQSIAIVVDEYGSTAGIISSEDLVEVVVGEISDRRGELEQLYTQAGQDVIIANSKLELTEFNELFSSQLSSPNNMVTLGGWLTEQLGVIPQAGIKHVTKDFLFQVLAADPNRVRRIYVRKLAPNFGYEDDSDA